MKVTPTSNFSGAHKLNRGYSCTLLTCTKARRFVIGQNLTANHADRALFNRIQPISNICLLCLLTKCTKPSSLARQGALWESAACCPLPPGIQDWWQKISHKRRYMERMRKRRRPLLDPLFEFTAFWAVMSQFIRLTFYPGTFIPKCAKDSQEGWIGYSNVLNYIKLGLIGFCYTNLVWFVEI